MLRGSKWPLDAGLRDQILSASADVDVVPTLLRLLQDQTLPDPDKENGGWAPTHAAHLLGQMRVQEAIEPMLRVLADTDPGDVMCQTLEEALADFGAGALEQTLQAYVDTTDDKYRDSLCAVPARLEFHDDRIFTGWRIQCLCVYIHHLASIPSTRPH